MSNSFDITPGKAANAVKEMSELMNCDYKTVWDKYTHQLIKDNVTWEDVEYLLNHISTDKVETQNKMRDATEEERTGMINYIKSISKPIGVNFFDLLEDNKNDSKGSN